MKKCFPMMSNPLSMQIRFLNQQPGGKWVIHGTNTIRRINCKVWNSHVEYPNADILENCLIVVHAPTLYLYKCLLISIMPLSDIFEKICRHPKHSVKEILWCWVNISSISCWNTTYIQCISTDLKIPWLWKRRGMSIITLAAFRSFLEHVGHVGIIIGSVFGFSQETTNA